MADAPRPPSRTALLTAVARGLYRTEPGPVILDDYLAFELAGDDGSEVAERLRAELPRSLLLAFCRWVCVRSRYTEDLVKRVAAEGVDQYVILGAGLDSFAYRGADDLGDLHIFEVDHPASQAWKRDRLGDVGIETPRGLVFASVDFEHETLRQGLDDAGFDFGRRSVFSWIGVTMYLTLEAIRATLATIAECQTGTEVVLTYNQPRGALDPLSAQVTARFQPIATEMGEPFVSLFIPGDIEQLLRDCGFADVVHFGPDEARAAYFDGGGQVEIAGAQRLVKATLL